MNVELEFISLTKATGAWLQGAHHVISGQTSLADHEFLGTVYTYFEGYLDKLIEKTMMITGSDSVACPVRIIAIMSAISQRFMSPVGHTNAEIMMTTAEMLSSYKSELERFYMFCEEEGMMSMGFDDFLMATSSDIEDFIYLVSRRAGNE